jgi:hypothetical protein
MEMGGQPHAPATLILKHSPGTQSVGGWVGPRDGGEHFGKEEISLLVLC